MKIKPLQVAVASAAMAMLCSTSALAAVYDNSFSLATAGQSLWSPGAQASWSYDSGFIGGQWGGGFAALSPVNFGLNGIVGDAHALITPAVPSVLITPYVPPVQLTPYIPPQQITPRVPGFCVPFVGCTPEVPAVYSPAVPATYSPAIPAVYSPAIPAVYGDTRTGGSTTVQTSGALGFNVKAAANAGGLGLNLPYRTSLTLPDKFVPNQLLHVGSSGNIANGASMAVDAPSFNASVNGIINSTNKLAGTGCFIGAGCTQGNTPANINKTFELIALDTTKPKPATALNGLLTLPVILGDDIPIKVGEQTVGHVAIGAPSDKFGGSVNGDTLKLSTNDTLLRTTADFGGIAQLALGVPVDVLQPSLDIAGVAEIGATLINLQGGINFGLSQALSFQANVELTLTFDRDVYDGKGTLLGRSVSFDLDSGADIMFKDRPTRLTYSFAMGAGSLFTNDTGLSIDPLFAIKAGCFNLSVAGGVVADLEQCALDKEFSTTDLVRASVYKKSFALEGFNTVSYDVALVPEPQSYALLLAGLGIVGFATRRRKV